MKTKKSGIKAKNPHDYQNKEFGKVVRSFDLIKSDKLGFAEVFSEGSPALKNLLLHMWDNEIETVGCCIGHEKEPYYEKDTLFGEKKISEREYRKHMGSSRYHYYSKAYNSGYLTININADKDKLRVLSEEIQKHLEKVRPYIPCSVSYQQAYGQNRIAIHLNQFVQGMERERFFSNVLDALSQVLGLPQKDVTRTTSTKEAKIINNPMIEKDSLDKIITQASTKVKIDRSISKENQMEL